MSRRRKIAAQEAEVKRLRWRVAREYPGAADPAAWGEYRLLLVAQAAALRRLKKLRKRAGIRTA